MLLDFLQRLLFMRKKTSLKDIAQHVGVSAALVSYVLNNKAEEKRVGKAIAEKIWTAAGKLNYSPNQIARSLKISKTNTIGLIVAKINYRFTTGITGAIEAEAKENNYNVILGSSDENPQKFSELMHVLINRQVDGLILVPVEDTQKEIEYLKKHEIPFVLIDRYFPEIETNYVALDNYKAAYQSVSYLIETGHKRIGFVNYKTTSQHLLERNRGYRQAMKDNKLLVKKDWQPAIRVNYISEDVKESIHKLSNTSNNCDAIFFATETLAITGLKNINELQLKVPDDLAVVSFDEAEAFELFYCPVTHARQPVEDMGKAAVDLLMEVIDDKNTCKQIIFNSAFIERKSCGEV